MTQLWVVQPYSNWLRHSGNTIKWNLINQGPIIYWLADFPKWEWKQMFCFQSNWKQYRTNRIIIERNTPRSFFPNFGIRIILTATVPPSYRSMLFVVLQVNWNDKQFEILGHIPNGNTNCRHQKYTYFSNWMSCKPILFDQMWIEQIVNIHLIILLFQRRALNI